MKKIIIILLAFFTFSAYGQAEYEKIAITDNVATASTSKMVSQQPVTGELNYINAANLPLSIPTKDYVDANIPAVYTTIVYVNATSPTTATIFDDENPPTVNDDALKINVANLYIGTDGSTWVYKTSPAGYVTKVVPASSNFNLYNTSIDAGNNKESIIERFGAIASKSGNIVRKNGSDSVLGGGYFSFYNNAITSGNTFQLNASNGLDLWNFASGAWNKRFTFSSAGDFLANGDIIGVLGTGKKMILGTTTSSGVYKYNFLNDRSLDTSFARLFLLEGKFPSNQVGVASMFTLKMTVPTGSPILTPTGPGMLFAFQNNAGIENFIGRLSVSTNGIVDNTGRLNLDVANAGSLNTVMSLYGSGNATIGTTTDNGLDKLQVNGSISATTYTGSATLTGTPTAPTATAGTNTTQIATTAFVQTSTASVASAVYGSDVSLSSGQSPYTLQLSDANARITTNGTFNQNYSIIIPTNASVPFQIGTKIRINISASQPGFATLSGAGITFLGANLQLRHGGSFNLTKVATDTWFVEHANILQINGSGNRIVTTGDSAFSGTFEGSVSASLNNSKFPVYTVATLPTTAPNAAAGNWAYVTDATAPTYLGTLTGGGSVVCPVFHNGTNWVSH